MYLYPSVGEGDVLKVNESDAHFRDRARVVRLDVVAYAEAAVEQRRCAFFHACHEEYPAVFHFGIKLLQPDCRRFPSCRDERFGLCVVAQVVGFACRAGDEIRSERVAEPP